MEEQDIGTLTHRQGRDPVPADGDVVDLEQRRAAAGQPEQALEGDRVVQVSADGQQPTVEPLDTGEVSAPEPQPRVRIRLDRDVGGAASTALAHPRTMGRAAHLPGVPEVAQTYVDRGVEVGIRAEVAIGQRSERLVDGGQSLGVSKRFRHVREPTGPDRRIDRRALDESAKRSSRVAA